MELLFISILMLMLLMIAGGTVAYCYTVGKRARRAEERAIVALDAASRSESRSELLSEELSRVREELLTAHPAASDDDDEKARAREEQYNELMRAKPPELLRFGGDDL